MQDSWQDHSSITELKPSFGSFPLSSSSSAVLSLSDGGCQDTNVASQTSDESGSVLKEHDYIGLAEVSSASVVLREHGNAVESAKPRPGALTMEETDLRLGLGPLIEPAVLPPKMASRAEDILSSLEVKKVEFKDVDARKEVIWPEMPIPEKPIADSRRERQGAYGLQQRNGGQDSKYVYVDGQTEQRSSQSGWQATTLRGTEGKFTAAANGFGSMGNSPATNGVKRGYSEAMAESRSGGQQVQQESEAKAVPPKHQQSAFWAAAKTTTTPAAAWQSTSAYATLPAAAMAAVPRPDKSSNDIPASDQQDAASNDAPFPKGQVVGWPPIRAYRKNTLAAHFVKVNMDGVQWGRKVDLNAHTGYNGLLLALEEMFQCSTTTASQAPTGRENHVNDVKPFRLLNGSDYVLTYEDKEGDWMLVGDVPWGLFVNAVRRLRIMRGSEATGLAPAGPEKPKCHA